MYKLLLPLFALAILIMGCTDSTGTPQVTPTSDGAVPFDGNILSGKHTVVLKTSLGDITLELDADAAPKTVTNFITLAKTGYYNDLTFHRVIPDFMLQGGDPTGNGTGGQSIFGDNFEDEISADSYGLHKQKLSDLAEDQPLPSELEDATMKDYLKLQGFVYNDELKSLPMKKGALAMANRGPNTNGSQFFIIQREGGTPWLEGKHTVFGKVTDGLDVVDAIVQVETGAQDKPVEAVTYTVEVVE